MPRLVKGGIDYTFTDSWTGSQSEYDALVAQNAIVPNVSYYITDGVPTAGAWTDVIGTLEAGETQIILTSNIISPSSTIEVFTDADINYNSITVASGAITIEFDAQENDVGVKVRIT